MIRYLHDEPGVAQTVSDVRLIPVIVHALYRLVSK